VRSRGQHGDGDSKDALVVAARQLFAEVGFERTTMRAVAARFAGLHDFQSFTDDDPEEKSTQVLVDTIEIYEDGDLMLIHIEGSHFLWKMVRRIVGVLVEIGRGGLTTDAAAGFLRDPSAVPARLTAPASGLFLSRVYYGHEPHDTQPVAITPCAST
jgi:tRNA pseudouridine38-40 synthase